MRVKLISDERYLTGKYRRVVGRELDLAAPRAFTAKLQWLKLNWRPAILTQCADKYEARQFVAGRAGPELLKNLYGVYERVEDINLELLPDKFVLKVNHGCKQNIFCEDKSRLDWARSRRLLRQYMKENRYYCPSREWSYKNIVPRILCEEHLAPNGEEIHEYNFYCFNGTPRFVEVLRRIREKSWVNMFDVDMNPVDRIYKTPPLTVPPQRTPQYEAMLRQAGRLCQGFPFVRVDLFQVNGRTGFGEMTFYPLSGLFLKNQESFDNYLGSFLELPEPLAEGEEREQRNGSNDSIHEKTGV